MLVFEMCDLSPQECKGIKVQCHYQPGEEHDDYGHLYYERYPPK